MRRDARAKLRQHRAFPATTTALSRLLINSAHLTYADCSPSKNTPLHLLRRIHAKSGCINVEVPYKFAEALSSGPKSLKAIALRHGSIGLPSALQRRKSRWEFASKGAGWWCGGRRTQFRSNIMVTGCANAKNPSYARYDSVNFNGCEVPEGRRVTGILKGLGPVLQERVRVRACLFKNLLHSVESWSLN